jgi:hypothetical protein
VARHLLDLASERAPELVAPVNQQLLAEAVGTVREVTVRALGELRAAGVVRTRRNQSSSSIRLGSSRNRTGTQVPDSAGLCGEHWHP